ncbi:hypothetical protein NOCA1160004 [metagenome]|uniref:Uncharacterized protein n=1 Tax=metagenome TaxID=256318 RepID=A0A2P2C9L0_9ZZZZ
MARGRRLPGLAPRGIVTGSIPTTGEGEISGRIKLLWLLSLAVLAVGCSADDPALPVERGPSASETAASESVTRDPVPTVDRDDLAAFLKKADLVDRVGAQFELRDVQYTSPTDAVAWFDGRKSGDTVISTTEDNWVNASHLLIRYGLAQSVSYLPLGRGAVAIKPEGGFFSRGSTIRPACKRRSGAVADRGAAGTRHRQRPPRDRRLRLLLGHRCTSAHPGPG